MAAGRRAAGLEELWRRGQHGWPARYPLVQAPNAPLLVALAAALVAGDGDSGLLCRVRGIPSSGLMVLAREGARHC